MLPLVLLLPTAGFQVGLCAVDIINGVVLLILPSKIVKSIIKQPLQQTRQKNSSYFCFCFTESSRSDSSSSKYLASTPPVTYRSLPLPTAT